MLPILSALAFAAAPAPADDFFVPTKVWQLHLDFTAKEYDALAPAMPAFPNFGQPAAPPKKPADGRELHRNAFNVDLPWAFAAVTADGQHFPKVGIRYKGNGTILDSMRAAKKSFKIDFDKYAAGARFKGMKGLNLHSGITDPSKARETIAYGAFRAAGVPAPRTTLVELTVSVPGKFDREYFGLYTAVEPIDKAFLRTHFQTDAGLLMKPERIGSLAYLGEDWERYKTGYQPKRDATPAEAKRVIEFVKLVNRGSDDEFRRGIESFIDLDAFFRFMAVTALTVNLDSLFTGGHNFYLLLHPETNKFHFLPWDLDRSMANFGFLGTMDQQMDLSLTKPYPGQSRLADRLLAEKPFADRYQKILREIAGTSFSAARLTRDLEAFEGVARELVAKDAKAAAARKDGAGMNMGQVPDIRTFIRKRTESVAAQLDGKSKGYVPAQFGFAPPPAPKPGELFLPQPVQDALRLTAEQKRKIADLQKELDAKLDEILTEPQRSQLRQMRQGSPPKKP